MSNLTKEQIQSMSYKEFDKALRHVHSKRRHKVTKTLNIHQIMRPVRYNNPKFKQYTKDELEPVITRIFELLRHKVIYEGYILVFPYNMGSVHIKDLSRVCSTFKEQHRVIDWQRSMSKWHNDGEIGKVYRNMSLTQQKAMYSPNTNRPINLKLYYRFVFLRSFRQEMKQAYLLNKLKCYE